MTRLLQIVEKLDDIKRYHSNRILRLDYIPIDPSLRVITQLSVKLADEHGVLIPFADDCGPVRISLQFVNTRKTPINFTV